MTGGSLYTVDLVHSTLPIAIVTCVLRPNNIRNPMYLKCEINIRTLRTLAGSLKLSHIFHLVRLIV